MMEGGTEAWVSGLRLVRFRRNSHSSTERPACKGRGGGEGSWLASLEIVRWCWGRVRGVVGDRGGAGAGWGRMVVPETCLGG